MILLREAKDTDLDALVRLASVPGMFNLTSDRELLKERIKKSKDSFAHKIKNIADTKYTFVAEDLATGKILATAMIAGQHGTPESPHFYFSIGNEKRFSEAINTGFIHGTLTLGHDTDGPSEIGALVVDPDARGRDEKIGRQISFVRFLYLGLHKNRFRPKVIAELLPPLNKRGLSPLWEAIGRRFTNMDYWEADQLCAKNKDFIFDLFPTGKIYSTFLPAEARNAIGRVGKETEPVVHMLKKVGFEYKNQVDPFDGGPHLWADVSQIIPIQKMTKLVWKSNPGKNAETVAGLLTQENSKGSGFQAVHIEAQIDDKDLSIEDTDLRNRIEKNLNLRSGDSVVFMPYY